MNHGGTEDTERMNLKSQHKTDDAILQNNRIEVQDQADLQTGNA